MGNPLCKGFFRFFLGGGKAGCTFFKRILSVPVNQSFLSECRGGGGFPFTFPAFYLLIDATLGMGIIIHNHLIALPVTFTRGINYGSRIFQHGYNIRYDEWLGEQVFCGTEQSGTLPFPTSLVLFIIFSVALPKGDVSAFQSFAGSKGAGNIFYPWITFIICPLP